MDLTTLADRIRCNVWHDGSHYCASPKLESRKDNRKMKQKEYTAEDYYFDYLYVEMLRSGISAKEQKKYLVDELLKMFPNMSDVYGYVEERCYNKWKNFEARKTRFLRKAYLNKWSYFATFTYDSRKWNDENDFKAALKRTLSNFAFRRGWRYSGVWERGSDNGRLHFHCLLYIPRGQLVGELKEYREYNPQTHRMEPRVGNTFFDETYGRSDFETILPQQASRRRVIGYILKYLQKSGERIVYSRDLPSEVEKTINSSDIITSVETSFALKFVLFDDVFESERFQSILSPD